MMVTEEQAKKRWCPHARVIGGTMSDTQAQADTPAGQAAHNRIDTGPAQLSIPDASACIASACMMWRWYVEPGKRQHGQPVPLGRALGWCGLAGTPNL